MCRAKKLKHRGSPSVENQRRSRDNYDKQIRKNRWRKVDLSSELLEPVDKPEDAAGDEEYCLPQNSECHLKLEFDGSTYSVSWPTEMSGEEFVELLRTPENIMILSEDSSTLEYQHSDFESGDFELPEKPTSIHSEVEPIHRELEHDVTFHWTQFPSYYRVGFTAESWVSLMLHRQFFRSTVNTDAFGMEVLERAYEDVEKEVRNRIP